LLPETWDQYLSLINKKDRKELKRKLNRAGEKPLSFENINSISEKDFFDFIELNKNSSQDKESFMTTSMQGFFAELVRTEFVNWSINLCFLKWEEKRIAAILYFKSYDQYLLYNSGLNLTYREHSPGLILNANLIQKAISEGIKVYDFMRGNERYKYDLGGIDLPLYQITLV
jgi:CelD/BcsL family acetyltransferase involved in cellulose biosynthesis